MTERRSRARFVAAGWRPPPERLAPGAAGAPAKTRLNLTLRLHPDELEALRKLAAAKDVSLSLLVRRLIVAAAADLDGKGKS